MADVSDVDLPPSVDSEEAESVWLDDCDSSIELPSSVDEDVEIPSDHSDVVLLPDDESFLDEDPRSEGEWEECGQVNNCPQETPVPSPTEAVAMFGVHDFAEFYSPPRIAPAMRQAGFRAPLSLDILTGWNFSEQGLRQLALQLLVTLDVLFAMFSPPCTIFSSLQRLWNIKKWTAEVFNQRWAEGLVFVHHCLQGMRIQYQRGRFFAFEHPASSSAWSLEEVGEVRKLPGVFTVVFDQCMLGLKSKTNQLPMRKRTRIMTNSAGLVLALQGCKCDGRHTHQTIQGSEGGVRRSVWAQHYPPGMVQTIVSAAPRMLR